MTREIIRPTSQEYLLHIPKKYLNQEVEILVLPFSRNKSKDVKRLLDVEIWDISEEDIKVKDWKIQTF